MASTALVQPLVFTGLLGWVYYRRIRSSFGRQPWRQTLVAIRMVILTIALFALALAAVYVPGASLTVVGGLAVGALLGALGLRHTQVELAEGKRWYTPNPWIGGALSLLLVGRLAYRMGSGVFGSGLAQASQNASPLTLGIAATLVAYYALNGAGLWWRMRELSPVA